MRGRMSADPYKVPIDELRLRSDSAGHKAGKDDRNLGAELHRVGPGPAYERWQRTPDDQEWRKMVEAAMNP